MDINKDIVRVCGHSNPTGLDKQLKKIPTNVESTAKIYSNKRRDKAQRRN